MFFFWLILILFFRERNFCARIALKAIDFGLSKSQINCKYFIENLGLKTIFPIFMKKVKVVKDKKPELQMQIDGIIYLDLY